MSEATDLRTFQRQASEAARGESKSEDERFVSNLLAERDRRIWPEESLALESRFGERHMRLFPFLGKAGMIQTPKGQGTLVDVKSYGCRVLLLRNKKKSRKGEKRRPSTENFVVEDVTPYRKERR